MFRSLSSRGWRYVVGGGGGGADVGGGGGVGAPPAGVRGGGSDVGKDPHGRGGGATGEISAGLITVVPDSTLGVIGVGAGTGSSMLGVGFLFLTLSFQRSPRSSKSSHSRTIARMIPAVQNNMAYPISRANLKYQRHGLQSKPGFFQNMPTKWQVLSRSISRSFWRLKSTQNANME